MFEFSFQLMRLHDYSLNKSLTLFSKNIRFGTIHILRIRKSPKLCFRNKWMVPWKYCLQLPMFSTSYLHTNLFFKLAVCLRTSGASRHPFQWCFFYINVLEYFLMIFLLWVLFNQCKQVYEKYYYLPQWLESSRKFARPEE